MVLKIGIIKVGNIGTTPVIDLILDERADREDIDVRTISSGAKYKEKAPNGAFLYSTTTLFISLALATLSSR